jgi:tetratricopeptide (TPR) repeat protein
VIGREPELGVIERFLDASPERLGVLVLEGEPGIGKTTLWEAGIGAAREREMRVLAARASGAEAQLSFAALTDLLEDVDADSLAALPSPQVQALEVALLRAAPGSAPSEPRAIALGLLNVLRALAGREAILVAVDDVQWLDVASAEALTFAGRRLEGEAVKFLLARRADSSPPLERALERRGLQTLHVEPLGLAETGRLLHERLGLSVTRELLRRIVEATGGNPLFAVELGRTLVQRGLPAAGEEMPVPDVLEDLLGTRVAGLPAPVRRLLLAVALSADLRASQLSALGDADALDEAVATGVLVVDRDHARPSHPLLAAAVMHRSTPGERGALHRELAAVVADEELRVVHLALATDVPDAGLAARVAEAAARAATRGAAREAVVLSEHALRLTPDGAAERSDRILRLGEYLLVAGEKQRLTDLLAPELDSLPRGAARVRALMLLTGGMVEDGDEIMRILESALAESAGDEALRAGVLVWMAEHEAVIRVERIRDAETAALEALETCAGSESTVERDALYGLGWARSLRGRPIDDVVERFHAVSDAPVYMAASPDRVAGQRLMWRGEVDKARAVLTRLLRTADERGEPYSYALQRLHVCQLALRTGEFDEAARFLDEWHESADRELLVWPMYERCRALLAAGRGLPEEAELWATRTIARAEEARSRWDILEALRARGTGALCGGQFQRAAASLTVVWEHTRREGVDEPGAFPVAPDLVEALVALGKLGEAEQVTARLRALSEELDHPWGRASAKQCSALIALAAEPEDDGAATDTQEAAAAFGRLGLRVDRARSMLSAGTTHRRSGDLEGARGPLESAAAAFAELGADGWAELARSELAACDTAGRTSR